MKPKLDSFAAFILSHGRPNNVKTYDSLRKSGYTGKIYLLVDDLDKTQDEYIKNFGDQVILFSKEEVKKTFDVGDNFNDMRTPLYARNANFEIAERLGLNYFLQLDDDYGQFQYRFNEKFDYVYKPVCDLDGIIEATLKFLEDSGSHCIAFAQGGDFIGGSQNTWAEKLLLSRKSMNSFFCSTKRPFKFVGTLNDDVNTYVTNGRIGRLFFTMNQVSLVQTQTQANPGGLTDLYLHMGTYNKSFYSVMMQPSSVKVRMMGTSGKRLHHSIKWDNTVPMILRESVKRRTE